MVLCEAVVFLAGGRVGVTIRVVRSFSIFGMKALKILFDQQRRAIVSGTLMGQRDLIGINPTLGKSEWQKDPDAVLIISGLHPSPTRASLQRVSQMRT